MRQSDDNGRKMISSLCKKCRRPRKAMKTKHTCCLGNKFFRPISICGIAERDEPRGGGRIRALEELLHPVTREGQRCHIRSYDKEIQRSSNLLEKRFRKSFKLHQIMMKSTSLWSLSVALLVNLLHFLQQLTHVKGLWRAWRFLKELINELEQKHSFYIKSNGNS